jgi:hypothetical protein
MVLLQENHSRNIEPKQLNDGIGNTFALVVDMPRPLPIQSWHCTLFANRADAAIDPRRISPNTDGTSAVNCGYRLIALRIPVPAILSCNNRDLHDSNWVQQGDALHRWQIRCVEYGKSV